MPIAARAPALRWLGMFNTPMQCEISATMQAVAAIMPPGGWPACRPSRQISQTC